MMRLRTDDDAYAALDLGVRELERTVIEIFQLEEQHVVVCSGVFVCHIIIVAVQLF